MKDFELITLDDGKLIINQEFRNILEAHDLTSFDAIMRYSGGTIVKQALKERYTTRILLETEDGEVSFFLKRYLKPPVWEYLKQFMRFTRPIVGARNEWKALLFLNRNEIPTAVPVAYGEHGESSLTMTLGIENTLRACDWFEKFPRDGTEAVDRRRKMLVAELARIVKKLHDSSANHQDLYLCHFLVRFENDIPRVFIIDNQRVMIHESRLPERWLVKDLAQFCFSAAALDEDEINYFLQHYGVLGNKRLIGKILRKRDKILKHTEKNRL